MSKYTITDEDIKLIQQQKYSTILDAQILNTDFDIIGNINGEIISASINIDAESDIRRTMSISLYPTDAYDLNENSKIWMDKMMQLNIGFFYVPLKTYKYYMMGTMVITDGSYTYDATNNILNLNLSDMMILLDGDHGGQLSEDTEISYGWVMSTVMESIVDQLGGVQSYSIDEMGMYYGIDYYIQKFQEDYVVDGVLLDIVRNAAIEARAYESTTVVEGTDIRKNTVNEVLEEIYNEYQNLDKNGVNFTFTSYEEFFYGFDYSVVNGQLVRTPNGVIPPLGVPRTYYLFNCPELLSYVGNNNLYIYDKYNNLRNVEIKMINDLVCVFMGKVFSSWTDKPQDSTLIKLSDNVLSSKVLAVYRKEAFISDTTYQKLVSALKYLIEVPYKVTASAGGSILGLITELRDMYPAWETFFESNGTFICQMIPTNEGYKPVLDFHVLDSVIISETRSFPYNAKNTIKVIGKTYNISNYAETCTYANGLYSSTLTNYTSYMDGSYICVAIPTTNTVGDKLRINTLTEYDIYDTATNEKIPSETLIGGHSYVFKYSSLGKWYLLGQYRSTALIKLVSYEPTAQEKADDIAKYNTTNVKYVVNPDDPYTVEKIGVKDMVLSGDDYDNIYSDSLAMSTAEYNLWSHTRLEDTITITTLPIPFLDVNQKVSYRLQKTGEIYEYIVKSISTNIAENDLSTTITMVRYYDLYPDIVTT